MYEFQCFNKTIKLNALQITQTYSVFKHYKLLLNIIFAAWEDNAIKDSLKEENA